MKEQMSQQERYREETHEQPEDDIRRVLRELVPQGSRAEFVDRGSEKLVFKFHPPEQPGKTPNRQSIMYKVDYRTSLFKNGKARDLHQPYAQEQARADMQEAITERKRDIAKLRDVFGYHAVPPERISVQMLPMSADLFNAIKRHDMETLEETPERIPALVTIQKRIELDPKNTVDLTASYAETPRKREGDAPEIEEETYERAHRRLIGDLPQSPKATDPKEREAVLAECIAMYPDLRQVITRAKKDPAFQEELARAAKGLIAYANDPEGTVLDLAGGYNIVMAKKPHTEQEGERTWQLYLLDALSPDRSVNIRQLEEIGQKILKGKGSSRDRISALNALHMVRMTNALAIIAGIPERAQLPEAVRKVPANMWRGFLNDVWSQQERAEASQPSHEGSAPTRVAVA